jgi:phytoene dehydrogenase-like protein
MNKTRLNKPLDTIIIGAGHNGLVTAAYLAKAGQSVLVAESRDVLGGAAATEEVFAGFKVDTGAHRIGGLNQKVVSDLGLTGHGLEILQADPSVFTPVEAGRPLTIWRDPVRTAEAMREISAADAKAWVPFTSLIAKAAKFIEATWTVTPPDFTGDNFGDFWSAAKLGLRLRGMGKRDMIEIMRILPMSVYELLDDWFESDLVRGTLAALAVNGMHQGTMAGGTANTLLHHHVGAGRGVIRPCQRLRGGIGSLSTALAAACRQYGAEIRSGVPVGRIIVSEGRACGVVLADGQELRARRVVSSVDAHNTFFKLLDPAEIGPDFARSIGNIRFRGVNAKVHLALNGLPDFSCQPGFGAHLDGTISISPSLEYVERAFDDANFGAVSAAPCLEVSIPSLSDSSLAPQGKHLMSIDMQYAPFHLREGQWDDTARETLGDLVVRTLGRYAPNIDSLIEARHVLTPLDLQNRFGLTEGSIYHGEMTLDQMHFMRPVPAASRYRAPVRGLYLCGSGTHPGGGVTGVPGFNAAREILKD